LVLRGGAPIAGPRQGIILSVVLDLLTLFALVGITFVLHSDTDRHGASHFRYETFALAEKTLDVAEGLGHDLVWSQRDEVDFGPHIEEIDELVSRAVCLKTKIQKARGREPDLEAQENLDALARKLELYESGLEDLRWIIKEIRLREGSYSPRRRKSPSDRRPSGEPSVASPPDPRQGPVARRRSLRETITRGASCRALALWLARGQSDGNVCLLRADLNLPPGGTFKQGSQYPHVPTWRLK